MFIKMIFILMDSLVKKYYKKKQHTKQNNNDFMKQKENY